MGKVIWKGVMMGAFFNWHCKDCGAGENLAVGGGFGSINDPGVIEEAMAGKLGLAMKWLLGEGIPSDWTVFRETAYYRCPGCNELVPGEVITIDEGSGSWLTFHESVGPCPKCGAAFDFWDDRQPLTTAELTARFEGILKGGCPVCGSHNVESEQGSWD